MSKAWVLSAVFVVMSVSAYRAGAQVDMSPSPAKSLEAVRESAQAQSSVERSAAVQLEAVKVLSHGQGVEIEVTTSKPITPTLSTVLDPSRLVIDFPDTVSNLRANHIRVNREAVTAVRVGVQPVDPPVTRVVLDLDQPRDYQVMNQGDRLIVKVGGPTVWDASSVVGNPATPKNGSSAETDASNAKGTDPSLPSSDAGDSLPPANLKPVVSATTSIDPTPSTSETAAPSESAMPATPTQSDAPVAQAVQNDPDHGKVDQKPSASSAPAASSANPTAEANQPSTKPSAQGGDSTIELSAPAKPNVTPSAKDAVSPTPPTDPPPETKASATKAAVPETQTPAQPAVPQTQAPAQSAAPQTQPPTQPVNAGSKLAAPATNAKFLVADATPPRNSLEASAQAKNSVSTPSTEYVIGEQDVLAVTVWREPELSGVVVVRPDGKITVPLVNELNVVGLTPIQLQDLLVQKLKPFVNVPQVTVSVRQINSRNVYLIGQAAHEGSIAINSSTTVLQLIAEVGGLRDFAKRKRIYVLRKVGDKQIRYPFNYDDVIRGRNTKQNIVLQPGDMVIVP